MAFRCLPLELHEDIATLLDSDKDLCTYTLICPEAHNAVHSCRGAVWRAMFAKKYDLLPGRLGKEIMIEYMERRMILWKGARLGFRKGHSPAEVRCMEVLRDLITESYSGVPTSGSIKQTSKNLIQLCLFIKASNILDNILFKAHRTDHRSKFLQAVQLTFAHWQLDLSIRSQVKGFGYSQQMVYSHPSKVPLFVDKKWTINTEYLLHVVNFFKYHMKTETENTLYPLLCDLDPSQRPAAWERSLSQGPGVKMLEPLWKGSYAYIPDIEDLSSIRDTDPGATCSPIPDAIDYDEGFQTLELDSSPMINSVPWPAAFEEHLHALPPRALCEQLAQQTTEFSSEPSSQRRSGRKPQDQHRRTVTPTSREQLASLSVHYTSYLGSKGITTPLSNSKGDGKNSSSISGPRSRKDYVQFSGSGKDYGPFHCTGILHNLPLQSGIPGWQRVSMMKYCVAGSSPSSASTSPSSPSSTVFSASTTSSASSTSSNIPTMNNPFGYASDDHGAGADLQFVLDEQCWCYEGIALPGGKIILGRWWHPLEEGDEYQALGPFIFWNVPS